MKNAPAVTARRATKRIVRAPALLVLAAIVETTAPETTASETQAAIVVAEQVVRVAIMRLMGLVVTGRQLIGLAATAIGPTRRVPRATATLGHRGFLATAPIRHVQHGMVTRVHVAMATAHTPRVRPARVTVRTLPARRAPAATAPIRHAHLAMAILLVGLHALVETDPIRRAPRVMLTGLIPHARRATARARIARVLIVHMAISRAVSGNPMGESVARSARR